MELTTRCPRCGTMFPATLEQLQLRKGYIRCPHCAHIFDGFDAVVADAGEADVQPQLPAPDTRVQLPAPDPEPVIPVIRVRGGSSGPEFTMNADTPVMADERPEPMLGSPGPALLPERAEAEKPDFITRTVYVEPRRPPRADQPEPLADFLDDREERRRGLMRAVWGVLILAALVLLAAQAAYVYRVQLASAAPGLRPVLERFCSGLGCEVPYPREIHKISITNSALRASAPPGEAEDEGRMVLEVTLRNNSEKAQQWPTLALDLVDFSGTVVVKKNLPPASYLSPDVDDQPFPPRSDAVITVPLALDGIKVNGFQLGKFFP